MKVFISWSGSGSNQVAQALRTFLKGVNHAIEPWMSETDIHAGSRWGAELAQQLEETNFGILCLTPESLTSPWLLFEAGALSKAIQYSFLCPYMIGLSQREVPEPLAQFQCKEATEKQTFQLLEAFNKAMSTEALQPEQLRDSFGQCWPNLKSAITRVLDNKKYLPRDHYATEIYDSRQKLYNAAIRMVEEENEFYGTAVHLLQRDYNPYEKKLYDSYLNKLAKHMKAHREKRYHRAIVATKREDCMVHIDGIDKLAALLRPESVQCKIFPRNLLDIDVLIGSKSVIFVLSTSEGLSIGIKITDANVAHRFEQWYNRTIWNAVDENRQQLGYEIRSSDDLRRWCDFTFPP